MTPALVQEILIAFIVIFLNRVIILLVVVVGAGYNGENRGRPLFLEGAPTTSSRHVHGRALYRKIGCTFLYHAQQELTAEDKG